MTTKKPLIERLKKNAGPRQSSPSGLNKAARAAELNTAISGLWQAEGTRSKTDFQAHIVPVYASLLTELKRYTTAEIAEQRVIDLLNTTVTACCHRWSVRLPMKRPGSDYRKYEIVYTYAVVTAMAVGCLARYAHHQSPEQLAHTLLPKDGLARLRVDPIVWEDWLGYFQQAERGGLYAVSVGSTSVQKPRTTASRNPSSTPKPSEQPSEPPVGSGRAMLAAIRQALADGSLSFNQPGDAIQVDSEGRTFLAHPAIFEWCIERLAMDVDVKRAKNRFDRLTLYKRSASGHQLFRGRLRERDPKSRGYVLEDAAVLWSEAPPTGQFVIEHVTGSD